jgi:hypothetical protein
MGAVVHERESSQNWNGSLAQGDPWNLVSTHVPAGRGPFKSWEDAAVDALVNCHPFAARNMDWSIGGTLTMLEQHNGLGYSTSVCRRALKDSQATTYPCKPSGVMSMTGDEAGVRSPISPIDQSRRARLQRYLLPAGAGIGRGFNRAEAPRLQSANVLGTRVQMRLQP